MNATFRLKLKKYQTFDTNREVSIQTKLVVQIVELVIQNVIF